MNPNDPKTPELMRQMANDRRLQEAAHEVFLKSCEYRYSYNFSWLGRPIIQYPEDLIALQEVIWATQPELIVETGVAHGGSLVFYASLLAILGGDRRVVGIDIDVRPHNRRAIEEHLLSRLITLIEGSSIADTTIRQVFTVARPFSNVMVVLDSMHSHSHVLAELRAYAPLVRDGGYLVILDTVVESMPKSYFPDRPWGPGDNPMTAINQFMRESDRFVIDEDICNKQLLSVAPRGFLRCLRNHD
jgi:cephalosporin hydroxylase